PSLQRPFYRPGPELVAQSGSDRRNKHNILIVGAGKSGRGLAAHLRQRRNGDHFVMGFVDDRAPVRGDVRGRVSDLARVIRAQFIDEVVITPPYDRELVQRVAREARRNRISVAILPELFGFAPQSVSFGTLGDTPILNLYQERRPLVSI